MEVQGEECPGLEVRYGAGHLSERQGELRTGRAEEGQTGKKMQLFWGQRTTGVLVLQGLPVSSAPAMATVGGRGRRGSWGSLSCVSGSRLR